MADMGTCIVVGDDPNSLYKIEGMTMGEGLPAIEVLFKSGEQVTKAQLFENDLETVRSTIRKVYLYSKSKYNH